MLGWRHITPGFVGGGILCLHASENSVKPEVLLNPPAVMIPQATTQTMAGRGTEARQGWGGGASGNRPAWGPGTLFGGPVLGAGKPQNPSQAFVVGFGVFPSRGEAFSRNALVTKP